MPSGRDRGKRAPAWLPPIAVWLTVPALPGARAGGRGQRSRDAVPRSRRAGVPACRRGSRRGAAVAADREGLLVLVGWAVGLVLQNARSVISESEFYLSEQS